MNRCAKFILAISAASIFLLCQSFLSPLQAGSNSKLIEAAKNEGTVAYYTTMTLSQSKKVADKFQAQYPFLKVDLFRSRAADFLRIIESKPKHGAACTRRTSFPGAAIWCWCYWELKILAPYRSRESN